MSVTRSIAWKILSQRALDTRVVAQFNYGDGTKHLPVSSGPVYLENEDYLPILSLIPKYSSSMDYWSREFSISDLSFSILNTPIQGTARFSDILDSSGSGNNRGYMNRSVDVRLWRPGITTFSDCLLLFTAVMRPPEDITRELVIFGAEDETTLKMRVVLPLLELSESADGVTLPAESIHKTKPHIYGDYRYYYGDTTEVNKTTALQDNSIPGALFRGIDSSGKRSWLIADHAVSGMVTDETDSDKLWAFHSGLKRMVEISAFTVEQNDANGCIVSIDPNVIYYDYVYGDTSSSDNQSAGGALWNGFNLVNDKFLGSYAEAFHTTDQEFPTQSWEAADFSGYVTPSGVTISEVRIFAKAYWDKQSGILNANVVFLINDRDVSAIIPQATNALLHCDTNSADEAGVNTDIICRFYKLDSNGTHEAKGRIYEVWKRVSFTSIDFLSVHFGGRGAIFPDWINNRATGDGYSVTHANNGDSGDPIQNLAAILESYLRDVLGLPTDKIDQDAFNVASVVLSGINGVYTISEAVDTVEELFSLAQSFNCFMFWTPDGRVSIHAIADTYTEDDADIIDGNLISDLEYGRTDPSNLYTSVAVEYLKGTTEFSDDATAQTWNNVTPEQSKLRFKTKNFNELTSANLIRDHKLANYKNLHNTVTGNLPLVYAHLGMGDVIGFENIPLTLRGEDLTQSYTIAGQTILPYFLIIAADRSEGLGFMAVQLHDLTT